MLATYHTCCIIGTGKKQVEVGIDQYHEENRAYALKPSDGWVCRFGMDMIVKAREITPGSGTVGIEFSSQHGDGSLDPTHPTKMRCNMCLKVNSLVIWVINSLSWVSVDSSYAHMGLSVNIPFTLVAWCVYWH
jgi:hypothetical protein